MADNSEAEIADPYAHLTKVLADAAEPGKKIRHSQEPPVAIVRAEHEASLWAVVVGDELVTTFRGDAEGFRSTIDLGMWIDGVAEWWTAEEEPQPPGFDRGGSAFR